MKEIYSACLLGLKDTSNGFGERTNIIVYKKTHRVPSIPTIILNAQGNTVDLL